MRAEANCRSCGSPIRWVITAAKGRRMPLDPTPVPDGNVWVTHYEGGVPVVEVVLTHHDVPRNIAHTYVSHFVTCAHADQWRQPR